MQRKKIFDSFKHWNVAILSVLMSFCMTAAFAQSGAVKGKVLDELGEPIIGANVFRDFLAGVRDFFGGRSASYEAVLREAKDTAHEEMARQAAALGANAVVGIDLDYETVGGSGSMLMVTCSGTAVRVE